MRCTLELRLHPELQDETARLLAWGHREMVRSSPLLRLLLRDWTPAGQSAHLSRRSCRSCRLCPLVIFCADRVWCCDSVWTLYEATLCYATSSALRRCLRFSLESKRRRRMQVIRNLEGVALTSGCITQLEIQRVWLFLTWENLSVFTWWKVVAGCSCLDFRRLADFVAWLCLVESVWNVIS